MLVGWFDNCCGNYKRHDKNTIYTNNNIYKDLKKIRDDQNQSQDKDDFTFSRGRATKKPVSYKE